MNRFFILALLFIGVLPLSFAVPEYPYTSFGGEIFFINASSHDLFWEIDIIDGSAGGFYYNRLCLEKGKISAAEYFEMLRPPEIVVKNNKEGGKTTHHNYYFDITDYFLNGK